MGNRAVITTEDHRVGTYIHWNGGRDSVEAFLEYCRLHGYRKPEDDDYGWARLCQVICNFIGADGCSVGIDTFDRLDTDNGDNGTYVIKDWKIISREFFDGEEQCEYELIDFLFEIDDSMPGRHSMGHPMIEDLLRTGRTLNDLGCDYFYSIWKGRGKKLSKFETGEEYRKGKTTINVISRSSEKILAEYNGGTYDLDVFHWKDGRESVTIETPDSIICVPSAPSDDD